MGYRILADTVVVFHLCFITFVVLGSLLVLRWPRVMLLHLPAVAWGVLVEANNYICPLTPLENHFRDLAADATYDGGFVEHYIHPIIYLPPTILHRIQLALVCLILTVNLTTYSYVAYRAWHRRASVKPAPDLTAPRMPVVLARPGPSPAPVDNDPRAEQNAPSVARPTST